MLAELVLSYYLANTEPMHLRTPSCPCANSKIVLHINKELLNRLFVDAETYVLRDMSSGDTGRAGAKFKVGIHIKDIDLAVFHESIHNLDQSYGMPLEMDGIELHWFLSK